MTTIKITIKPPFLEVEENGGAWELVTSLNLNVLSTDEDISLIKSLITGYISHKIWEELSKEEEKIDKKGLKDAEEWLKAEEEACKED